ncbi:MAG: hypothetical protein V2B19_08405 [Pseudomonadota bacterium]
MIKAGVSDLVIRCHADTADKVAKPGVLCYTVYDNLMNTSLA